MKRSFSILAVICLIVSLAVPTLAAESYEVYGEWTFNDTITFYTATATQEVNFDSYSASGTARHFEAMYFTTNSLGYKEFNTDSSAYTAFDSTGWNNVKQKQVDFGETPQEVSHWFYEWLKDNARPSSCDGTACSVADYDIDGVCDTCGGTLAYSLQRTYTPNTYPSSLPVLPLGFNDSDDFVVVEVNGVTYLHAFVNYGDLDHWDTRASSTSYRATAYGVNGEPVITKYYKYQLLDGDWNSVQTSLTQTTTTFGKFEEVNFLYSTIDIKDSDGNIFFPVPLWMEMDRVTQGEMTQTAGTVVGTMTTLVLCGVGCLALLVVLKLFGKRSLIYRN